MPSDQRLVARADVWCAEIDGTQVLYDPEKRRAHVLNAGASTIWALLGQLVSPTELADQLVDRVDDLDRPSAERDVGDLLTRLVAEGLVVHPSDEPRAVRASPPITQPVASSRSADAVLRSRTMRIVGQHVVATSSDRQVIDAVDWWGAPLHVDAPADRELRVEPVPDVLRTVPSLLNRVAADSTDAAVLHCGAIARGGAAVLLPGGPGEGKSTLTAALVSRGWQYLTDEAVGLRPDLAVLAYPKRLSLEIGSWPVLDGVPGDERSTRPGFDPGRVRWVDPRDLHADALALDDPAPACSLVVAASFRAGARLQVRRLGPVEAFTMLLANDFNLPRVGISGFQTLRRVVTEVPVHEVLHGELDDAVRACESLADAVGTGSQR